MTLPYRPNVCILLFNQRRELLLGERYGSPGAWQLPQGGVELDQSIEDNVLREIEEELGIPTSLLQIEGCLKARNRYDFETPPAYAVGVWRGQDQTFWVVRFLGEDSQINVATEHPEFSSWKWASTTELREKAEKKRLAGYEAAIKEYEQIYADDFNRS